MDIILVEESNCSFSPNFYTFIAQVHIFEVSVSVFVHKKQSSLRFHVLLTVVGTGTTNFWIVEIKERRELAITRYWQKTPMKWDFIWVLWVEFFLHKMNFLWLSLQLTLFSYPRSSSGTCGYWWPVICDKNWAASSYFWCHLYLKSSKFVTELEYKKVMSLGLKSISLWFVCHPADRAMAWMLSPWCLWIEF